MDRLTDAEFSGPDRSITLGVEVSGRFDQLDHHQYRLGDEDWCEARWAGLARFGLIPAGAEHGGDDSVA